MRKILWKLLLVVLVVPLRQLFNSSVDKTLRYNELHKLIPKATDKMLAQQLRELEKDGLINRKVYPVVPPKTEYSLTAFGKTLTPILDELCKWGENYLLRK